MRTARVIAAATVLLVTATGCSGGGTPVATSSAPATSAGPSTSPTTSAPSDESTSAAPTTSASEQPTAGPSSTLPPQLAAYQLCGTVLALAAGFVGQIAPEQLDEAQTVAQQSRDDYVDDGSGLAQKADAVLAAVEFADQTKVVSASKAFADACKQVDPGT